MKALRREIRELREDQKFAQMRIDRLQYQNTELDRELVIQKEVVKSMESSRHNLLQCTQFFHLRFIQLQNSMEGITKLMSKTTCFSLEDRKGDIFLNKTALPSLSNLTVSCESSQAASISCSLPERNENDNGKAQVRIEPSLPENPLRSRTTYAPRKKAPKYKAFGKRRNRFRRKKGSKVADLHQAIKTTPSQEIKTAPRQEVKAVPRLEIKTAPRQEIKSTPSQEIMKTTLRQEIKTPPRGMNKVVQCELCPRMFSSKYAVRRHQCISHHIHSYQRNGTCVNYHRCGSATEMVTSSTTDLWL